MTLYDDSTVDDFPPEPQVSEPKTPRELADAVLPIPDNDVGREFLAGVFASRDEQIRQHERARVREVLLDRLRWNRPRGFGAAVSETLGIAMDLGIDLEDGDV